MKYDITFVCPTKGQDLMRYHFEGNIQAVYGHLNYKIIYVNQLDKGPFLINQLRNIGFFFAESDYIIYRDIDVVDMQMNDPIAIYDSIENPYNAYNKIQYLAQGEEPGLYNPIGDSHLSTNKGYTVFKKEDWIKHNGFSNLYLGNICNDINNKRYDIKNIETTIGCIWNDSKVSLDILLNNTNSEIDELKDGYRQLYYEIDNITNYTNNIQELFVKNIKVKENIIKDDYIVVTMTTWKKRINNIPHIIDSIMNNTLKPDKICINLCTVDFPNKEKDFPQLLIDKILEYKEYIRLNWLKNNTKVWKKLIPTLYLYPEAVVISIDDDFEYPNDMIEVLYDEYCKYDKQYPISGNDVRIFNVNCHCGCASLTTYNLLNKNNQFNSLPKACLNNGSDDIFYSLCALINGNEYKQCTKEYFMNMDLYHSNNSYSKALPNEKECIAKTWKHAVDNILRRELTKIVKYICQPI